MNAVFFVRLFVLLSLFTGSVSFASPVKHRVILIRLDPTLFGSGLQIGNTVVHQSDTITISSLRLYLSKISLYQKGKRVFTDPATAHLLDFSSSQNPEIRLAVPQKLQFDQIRISLGIDSLTNVSGALGGDLDPSLGMYWAWQSGYINFKLEGFHSRSTARDHAFQFHLGGYLPPYAAVQDMTFSISPGKDTLRLQMDFGMLIDRIDPAKTHSVMSPGEKAVEFSRIAAQLFRFYED